MTGRRLLVADGPGADERRQLLAAAGATLARQSGVSSLHVTFANEAEWTLLGQAGYLQRTDQQYHFLNEGYRDFDDFLAALSSRKRKVIKRERRDALAGLDVQLLTGSDITEAAWDAFFAFYQDTGSRKWGRPYLNRRFFSLIGERMADRILLMLATDNGRPIAGALNFIGSDTLYGRYWGAIEEHPFLHFELCYYQAIEWASTTSWRGSRPARRASTSWRGATGQPLPTPPTGSPTPASARRSPTTSRPNAARSPAPARRWRSISPSGKTMRRRRRHERI